MLMVVVWLCTPQNTQTLQHTVHSTFAIFIYKTNNVHEALARARAFTDTQHLCRSVAPLYHRKSFVKIFLRVQVGRHCPAAPNGCTNRRPQNGPYGRNGGQLKTVSECVCMFFLLSTLVAMMFWRRSDNRPHPGPPRFGVASRWCLCVCADVNMVA